MSTQGHIALKKTDDPVEKARILVHLAGIEEWLSAREDKVNELLERAQALDPDNTEALYRIADRLLENDNKDKKALNLLTRAVHLAPYDALYLYKLGSLYMELGQMETARVYFRRAANTDVSTQDTLRKRAQSRADSLVRD